jgi:hypothetical protein
MKKIVAVLVVLALFTSTVFAGPVSRASLIDTVKTVKIDTASSFAGSADLFGDVQAPALSDTEAMEVEGEGFWGAVAGAVAGGCVGGVIGAGTCAVAGYQIGQSAGVGKITSVAVGAVSGALGFVGGFIGGAVAGGIYGGLYGP